jgi:hypothetical protein
VTAPALAAVTVTSQPYGVSVPAVTLGPPLTLALASALKVNPVGVFASVGMNLTLAPITCPAVALGARSETNPTCCAPGDCVMR